MKKKIIINRNTIYHILYITSLFLLIIWLIPVFIPRIIRLWKGFLLSLENVWLYFKFVFAGIEPDGIQTSLPIIDSDLTVLEAILPIDPYIFWKHITVTFTMPFNLIIMEYWFFNLLETLTLLLRIALMIIMVVLCLKVLFINYYELQEFKEEDIGKESKPKKIFLKVISLFKKPYEYIRDFIHFSIEKKIYLKLALAIFLFRINFISIAMESISLLFAFVVSFDFTSLWIQICCIIVELFPVIKVVPLFIWIIAIYIILARKWIRDGDDEIRHQHLIIKGILREKMTTTNFFTGPPGAGKDLLGTQLAIVEESNMRYDLKEIMLKIRSEYPEFDFVTFEYHIQQLITERKVVNWAQAEVYIYNEGAELINNDEDLLFGYKWKEKKNTHYNELHDQFIVDALSEYAHAYFMYAQDTVLCAANYAIRFDNIQVNNGHSIIYDDDFMTHDNRLMDDYSQYCHINNFDWQRLFKKVKEDDFCSLEDGCILVLSEYAKERLNKNELKEMKVNADEANQMNDGTNTYWKTKSHENVIRQKRFGKAFINDQRDQSLNADNREVFEYTWKIKSKGESRSALPGFWYSRIILDFVSDWFNNQFRILSDVRSDDPLWFYIVKKVNSLLSSLQEKMYNRWGMHSLLLENQYNEQIQIPILYKLAYAERYDTGLFGSMYIDVYLNNKLGFNDSPTYKYKLASRDELKLQNSYSMNRFYGFNKQQDEQQVEENNLGF